MQDTLVGDPPLAVAPWRDGRGATLELQTRYLNFDVADDLRRMFDQRIRELLDARIPVIVLDLTAVSVIDSAGAVVLVEIDRIVRTRGATLWLVGVASFLNKVFRWMHVESRLSLASSEEEVRRSLVTR
jgi:anti-anti-sigma factor